jgi:hypothetical protein
MQTEAMHVANIKKSHERAWVCFSVWLHRRRWFRALSALRECDNMHGTVLLTYCPFPNNKANKKITTNPPTIELKTPLEQAQTITKVIFDVFRIRLSFYSKAPSFIICSITPPHCNSIFC